MSHTNTTTNYALPLFVGTDTPGWLTDVNGAMNSIDAAIYARQQAIATNSNDILSLTSRIGTAETDIDAVELAINDPSTGILARLSTDEDNISDNTTNIGINSTAINNLSGSITAVQASLPVTTATTIEAANWIGDKYTISDAAVTANSVITIGLAVGCSDAEADAWNGAEILPYSMTAGSGFVIREKRTVPTSDIAVTYVRQG